MQGAHSWPVGRQLNHASAAYLWTVCGLLWTVTIFGVPDMTREQTRFALDIPRLGSLILTRTWDGQVRGLKSFLPEDRPNSAVVFWTFRVMVGLGTLMILLGVWAAWARWRNYLYTSHLLQRFALWMGCGPQKFRPTFLAR